MLALKELWGKASHTRLLEAAKRFTEDGVIWYNESHGADMVSDSELDALKTATNEAEKL